MATHQVTEHHMTEVSPSHIFSIDDLCICYGQKPALDAVSLDIRAGEITALVGPSGCGKTSFLNALNRMTDLISGCHVNGRIMLGGESVTGAACDRIALRRRVGMIFQRPNPFPLSIFDNIAFALKEHGLTDATELKRRVMQVLEDVGLLDEVKDRLDRSALELSGGQQQRLCMARALVLEPEVLLMDEPCSALDPLAGGVVEDLIASLRGRYTVVIVTHNLAQARRIADRVAFFWLREGCGCLIEEGPVAQMFEEPKEELTAAYMCGARG